MKRTDLQSHLRRIEQRIGSLLGNTPPALRRFQRHVLRRSGKKQRGKLLLLLGDFFSVSRKETLTAAAGVEIVHLASLIHDDIVDGSGQRRAGPTLHRIHGVAQALLYGDILFSRGISAVNRLGNQALTDLLLDTVHALCLGEIMEGESRGEFPWEENLYFQIVRRKTASLFQFACQAPGVLAGLSKEKLTILRWLGLNLGCAFQIADDCLDFAPLSSSINKDRFADLRNGVPNFPLLIAGRRPALKRKLKAAIGTSLSESDREKLSGLIRDGGAVRLAVARAGDFLDRAEKELGVILTWRKGPGSMMLEKLLSEQRRRLRKLAEY